MEPKHKELLAQCRQSLAQSMTEVDKVIELLEATGTLSPRDLHELREAAGGGAGGASKADRLIQLLLAKDRDHFQDLRVALEKTQPHLLSILYLNGVAGAPPGETADVSWRIHSSTLAERLCQIRRQTSRNKEDVFCEVLQSTDATRGETRAWRKTINERQAR